MTTTLNEIATPAAIVSSVLYDLRNGRLIDASAHFAEAFSYADHGIGLEFKEKARLTEFFFKAREFYPDSSFTTNRVLTSGDHVIVEWTYRATISEPFYGGMAMQVSLSVQGASIAQVQDGEIIDWADYYDGLKSRRTALAAHFQDWFEL
jgi:steroid delta-isomerase-like uncharacterized protein